MMMISQNVVVMAILALVMTNTVSSQANADTGNPTDSKDLAANLLDTNPPGKTEIVGSNTAAENTASATNLDNTAIENTASNTKLDNTAAEKTAKKTTKGSDGVASGKNGVQRGKEKSSKPKRRRKNRRKGRKRIGNRRNGNRRKPSNKSEKSIKPTTKPTTTPKIHTQPRAQLQSQTETTKTKPPKKSKDSIKPTTKPTTTPIIHTQPQAQATKTKATTIQQPMAEPLKQEMAAKTETIPSKKKLELLKQERKVKTKTKPAKNAAKPSKEQAAFFKFFDDEAAEATTTTQSTLAAGPPPDIVFDKTSKKVMPEVDTKNSKAHDGRPCNETYMPHETSKHKYKMRYAEEIWGDLDCPPNLDKGLVWRQDLCSCGEELIAYDPNDWCAKMGFNPHPTNKHQYTRRHHGARAEMDCAPPLVWSQEKCLCMYDPMAQERPIEAPGTVTFACKKILHLEFEGNMSNTAEAYHVQQVSLKRRGKLPRIRYVKVPGATDRAAMIVSQPLEFLAFRGNDFQKQVTYWLNFKLSPRHLGRRNFMVLITDECLENQGGRKMKKPSISLRFQPNTRNFRLEFRTEEVEIDELIKGAKPDKYGWYKTVVYFEDNSLNLETNGKKLFTRQGINGKIPQNKCPLYIAGRGRGFDRSQDFYGYMDNVQLVKDCKFHDADIKML